MDDAGSRLVFGCMGLGGGWGAGPLQAADVAIAHEAVDAALESGIRVFDHADIYAHGRAEEAFGRVLAERPGLRDALHLQTKCGIVLAGSARVGQYDASAGAIAARVEDSLRRLGTDRIDTLLIHRPDPLAHPEEVATAYARLRQDGKVGRLGVSNMSAPQMEWLQSALDEPLAVNQLEMSLHRRDWLETGVLVNHPESASAAFPGGTIEYCVRHGAELQAWGSLAQGRYSGRPRPEADDAGLFAAAEGHSTPHPDVMATRLVAEIAEEHGCAPESVVLAWLMRHPAGIRPVVGTSNPERIRACADAGRVAADLTRDQWYALWIAARGRPLP
jgi:predicted oxidoreductase